MMTNWTQQISAASGGLFDGTSSMCFPYDEEPMFDFKAGQLNDFLFVFFFEPFGFW